MSPAVAAAIGALTIVSCSNNLMRTGAMEYSSLYDPYLVRYAMRTGEIRAVVRGNPFGPGPVDADAIAGAFYLPVWVGPAHVTAHPRPDTPSNNKIVLLFGPHARGPGGDETCATPETQPVEDGSGPIRLQATFCVGARWVSTLVAAGPGAKSANDPAFRALMTQVGYDLFPPFSQKRWPFDDD
ncbi:MAG TPA: hypothetical protein VEU47_15735 [Candidatus Cybelea sp.]|nr:hypothetical protein [Candidatus Cybelea sp.]